MREDSLEIEKNRPPSLPDSQLTRVGQVNVTVISTVTELAIKPKQRRNFMGLNDLAGQPTQPWCEVLFP